MCCSNCCSSTSRAGSRGLDPCGRDRGRFGRGLDRWSDRDPGRGSSGCVLARRPGRSSLFRSGSSRVDHAHWLGRSSGRDRNLVRSVRWSPCWVLAMSVRRPANSERSNASRRPVPGVARRCRFRRSHSGCSIHCPRPSSLRRRFRRQANLGPQPNWFRRRALRWRPPPIIDSASWISSLCYSTAYASVSRVRCPTLPDWMGS